MSRVVRKPAFRICENEGADQLGGDHEADQSLCFRYTNGTIPLLPKFEISSLYPSSMALQLDLCGPENRFSHNEVHIRAYNQYHRYILLNAQPKKNNLCHLSGVESG